MSTENPLAVVDTGQSFDLYANPKELAHKLQAYTDSRALFVRWLKNQLVAGVDYTLIHRKLGQKGNKYDCKNCQDKTSMQCDLCGAKATLCKPGSEKIVGLLKLRPAFVRDTETWEMMGKREGLICLTCTLFTQAGEAVSEGRGCRDSGSDYGDVNKSVKMAEKSAQIDAVLRHVGLSELFTLDLDDPAVAKASGHVVDEYNPAGGAGASNPPPELRTPAAPPTGSSLGADLEADLNARAANAASTDKQIDKCEIWEGPIEGCKEAAMRSGKVRYGIQVAGQWMGTDKDELGQFAHSLRSAEKVCAHAQLMKDGRWELRKIERVQ